MKTAWNPAALLPVLLLPFAVTQVTYMRFDGD